MTDDLAVVQVVLIYCGFGSATIGGVVSAVAAIGTWMSGSRTVGIVATILTAIQAVFIVMTVVATYPVEMPGVLWLNLGLTLLAVGLIVSVWVRRPWARKGTMGKASS